MNAVRWGAVAVVVGVLAFLWISVGSSPEIQRERRLWREGLTGSRAGPSGKGPSKESALRFDTVSLKDYGPDMVGVQFKVTNISGRAIRNAQVTCLLRGADGREFAFQRHYAIKSDAGLAPGASTYVQYVIDAARGSIKSIDYHVEAIAWQ